MYFSCSQQHNSVRQKEITILKCLRVLLTWKSTPRRIVKNPWRNIFASTRRPAWEGVGENALRIVSTEIVYSVRCGVNPQTARSSEYQKLAKAKTAISSTLREIISISLQWSVSRSPEGANKHHGLEQLCSLNAVYLSQHVSRRSNFDGLFVSSSAGVDPNDRHSMPNYP